MKRFFSVAFIGLFLLLGACDTSPPPDQGVADKIAENFMNALNKHDYDLALSMVSDEFFDTRSRGEWIAYFKDVAGIMGEMTSMHLKNKLDDTRLSGTFYIYEYRTKYEHGLGKELITMIHKINTGDAPLKIFSYKIESSKLEKLNQSR